MSVIKCKMCGGDLELIEGSSVAVCEYCGSQQTVPAVDNEKKLTLFARANRLRLACEFDKAAGVYESIVADFPTEAEAYWGLVLCRYGIEYVDDPATGKKIPTCHRSSFDSVMEDSDFEQALENADTVARRVYRDEAKAIEELRRGIVEVSGKEPPYDIFICYKETAEDGQRTVDSVIAQDVYDALTEKGYRVFFSRISLEDKLGTEYEPYIFAALHSAKIMLAFGTDYEYYNAVWVKNEWSRFLQLMTKDKSKHLIPCYKGIDAYDMPKEFAKLQAQDMGKVGAMQDLLRGVDKIMGRDKAVPAPTVTSTAAASTPAPTANPTVTSLLERAEMFLADGNWRSANTYCEKVLDIEPQNGTAYFYKLMAKLETAKRENLKNCTDPFDTSALCEKVFQYGTEEDVAFLRECNNAIRYRNASKRMGQAKSVEDYERAAKMFAEILDYKDVADCMRKAEEKVAKIEEESKIHSSLLGPKRAAIAPYQKMIVAGESCTLALKSDGRVVAAGDPPRGVSYWFDMTAVAVGSTIAVALKSDGTVVAKGYTGKKLRDYSQWRDIVSIVAAEDVFVGLTADGEVQTPFTDYPDYDYDDENARYYEWSDIVAIAIDSLDIAGLKANGTVVTTRGSYYDVSDWHDIVAIAAGHTIVGLKADGTVVTAECDWDSYNEDGQCNVSDWCDIVAIAASNWHTVGLKADGTVVAVGDNNHGQCDVSDWRDIVAIAAGDWHTVGLKADGTVVAVGDNKEGKCNVSDWKLFYTEKDLAEKRASLTAEKEILQSELLNLGLFSGKRRKEIGNRLAKIEMELKAL